MPIERQLKTNYSRDFTNDRSWLIVILIIILILFVIFPPIGIALFILTIFIYSIRKTTGGSSRQVSGLTPLIKEKQEQELMHKRTSEINYRTINRTIPMKGRRKCWYCKKWFEDYSAKPIRVLRDPNEHLSYTGYGTYYWYDTHICKQCYEKNCEGKEMPNGEIFPKWDNYCSEFSPSNKSKKQDVLYPIKSTIWATSKWHIYRINIEKNTGFIISVRRWTRKDFKQFGKKTYNSVFQRVPKNRRGVHYLDYIKKNGLKLKVEKKIYDLSDKEKVFLKNVETQRVLVKDCKKSYEIKDMNIKNLIKKGLIKSITLITPYISKEFNNKQLIYTKKNELNEWAKNNFPNDIQKILRELNFGKEDTIVYIKKNDFKNKIKWIETNVPNHIIIDVQLDKLRNGKPILIHEYSKNEKQVKLLRSLEKEKFIIKRCRYCHEYFIPLKDLDGLKERIFQNYTHIKTLNEVNFCRDHVFPTPWLPGRQYWYAGYFAEVKERMIKTLKELVDIIGFIPPRNCHDIGYLGGLEPDKFDKAILILNEMPPFDLYYSYKAFGSWFDLLSEAELLKDGILKTDRGYKCKAQDGHSCNSLAEKTIDDWLYKHGIEHEKEPKYPGRGNFRGDWRVGDYFIEYWGLKGDKDYDNKIYLKREIAKENKIKLIEINPNDINKLAQKLNILLKKENEDLKIEKN